MKGKYSLPWGVLGCRRVEDRRVQEEARREQAKAEGGWGCCQRRDKPTLDESMERAVEVRMATRRSMELMSKGRLNSIKSTGVDSNSATS
jgi:hypothetical protein